MDLPERVGELRMRRSTWYVFGLANLGSAIKAASRGPIAFPCTFTVLTGQPDEP